MVLWEGEQNKTRILLVTTKEQRCSAVKRINKEFMVSIRKGQSRLQDWNTSSNMKPTEHIDGQQRSGLCCRGSFEMFVLTRVRFFSALKTCQSLLKHPAKSSCLTAKRCTQDTETAKLSSYYIESAEAVGGFTRLCFKLFTKYLPAFHQ